MEKFDLIVIGGGPAGYAAAMRGLDFKKKVCLIEKANIGGAGIFNGALSSKTLWELSEKVSTINEMLKEDDRSFEISWKKVQSIVRDAVSERENQYLDHIQKFQELDRTESFTWLKGTATFETENEISIENETGKTTITGENIVIATGSSPRGIPICKLDEKYILSSDGIEHVEDFPKSMVIVGAGVIGCEYAAIFANFGKTKVHIIDRQDRILPFEDEDISSLITHQFGEKGIVVHQKASLVRLEVIDNEVEYELSFQDKPNEIIRVEKALLSVGRNANIQSLGLEKIGIKLNERGSHIAENDCQTNIPNIYVAGDVSERINLVNMAEIEGRHSVRKMYASPCEPISYDNVCTIMFLSTEVAAVGLNEQECVARNIPIKVVKMDFSLISRAIAMRKTDGFFKIIVTNDEKMQILGMRAVGEHASAAIQAIGMMIKLNVGIEVLTELIHPHPSIVEGVRDCVRILCDKSMFKTTVFDDKLACYSVIDGVKTPLKKLVSA